RLDLLRREAVPAAHGSIRVLSKLAAIPPRDATVEQRPECDRHALRLLLERRPHRLRRAKVSGVTRIEKIGIERRAVELALFVERLAQVVRDRLDVDRRDARFPLQHGHPPPPALASSHAQQRDGHSMMATIVPPKWSDGSIDTSAAIEVST